MVDDTVYEHQELEDDEVEVDETELYGSAYSSSDDNDSYAQDDPFDNTL
jgi:hypothetical protein